MAGTQCVDGQTHGRIVRIVRPLLGLWSTQTHTYKQIYAKTTQGQTHIKTQTDRKSETVSNHAMKFKYYNVTSGVHRKVQGPRKGNRHCSFCSGCKSSLLILFFLTKIALSLIIFHFSLSHHIRGALEQPGCPTDISSTSLLCPHCYPSHCGFHYRPRPHTVCAHHCLYGMLK